jgi:hypothetical protein
LDDDTACLTDTDEISRIRFTVKKRLIQVTFEWSIAKTSLSMGRTSTPKKDQI